MSKHKLCLINVVGLTPAHVGEHTPHLARLATRFSPQPLESVTPAVTCSAQATLLTGTDPTEHGVVGNGWLYRDTAEIRFWQQSNYLLARPPVYETAKARAADRGREFTCAKLFWWFNQGAAVDWSLTPKPHYGSDGNKVFDVQSTPADLAIAAQRDIGPFPFHAFWGPLAGRASTDWIAAAAAWTLRQHRPTLTLVYLPHLDYDLQRFGPQPQHLPQLLAEVDAAVGVIAEDAARRDIEVAVVSEYGIVAVDEAILPNQALRRAGFLEVRDGPFGENVDTFQSRAVAVCDHQLAHIYVRDPNDRDEVAALVGDLPGVASVLVDDARAEYGLAHHRSGEVIALAQHDRWFAYPYWLSADRAPDFARTVDIHRKIGYDPCELFFDPQIPLPKLRAGWRLLQKRLGMRTRLDVIGLDPSMVRGSHGVAVPAAEQGPVYLGPGQVRHQRDVHDAVLAALDLG